MVILITGGAGFIGSNLIHYWLQEHSDDVVVNFDALTYAGNLANLEQIENHPRYRFFHGDLRNTDQIDGVFSLFNVEAVIHLAAESHVDRSIYGPSDFIDSNIRGTFNLLEALRKEWDGQLSERRFLHVSTDEVYGSLGGRGYFRENTPFAPNSPYSASKASSDHLVRAWHHTYGMDTVVTHCSNNYGPYQFPEKLIPLIISNCIEQRPLPIYGDGRQVRDWLYVEDFARGIEAGLSRWQDQVTWHFAGQQHMENRRTAGRINSILDAGGLSFGPDRQGQDSRYALNDMATRAALDWAPRVSFEDGLLATIDWYRNNAELWDASEIGLSVH